MHGPTQLFTVIALVSLPTVMYGGYALMGVMRDRNGLNVSYRKLSIAHVSDASSCSTLSMRP